MLALRGGGELVALWAQLASVIELVSGVALAGVGTGLAVYAARTQRPERQADLLREALRLGLRVTLPVALAIGVVGAVFQDFLLGGKLSPALIALGATAGWAAVVTGVVNSLWLGQQRRGRMLALALGSAALALAVSILASDALILPLLTVSQAVPALAVLFALEEGSGKPRFRVRSHPLARYILPGLAIGILSPASLLVARGAVGEALSWHEAGVLQALWRVSDWVCGFAGGILSVHFLPRFAAARGTPRFAHELRRAALFTLVPSAAVFLALYFVHRPVVAALYLPELAASDQAVALLFAGNVMRIASWVPLFALFALRRTGAIAAGELLSPPLFAYLLTVLGNNLSLEAVGILWLVSYTAYLAFNSWAVHRR